ncbi:hypothetical protein HJC23_005594 [Cyclotella cryptica]|uniref:Uncharacterized protein n=1 Tax=Cyclotella cryptica TaxID=29204 RepID=A0ABD3PQY7_9STRA|eukprot:CCRYP_012505-RA/>CCRYP_012505-RA protein AED:0.36 eAED:0.36 QI:0/-1/0/1/-1/1/1/0/100
MNTFIASLVLIIMVANHATAFTTTPMTSVRKQYASKTMPPITSANGLASTTALQLKVKVDPEAKGNKNVAGNAKMAAYGGSIVVAVLLPVAFLIWAAVSH